MLTFVDNNSEKLQYEEFRCKSL